QGGWQVEDFAARSFRQESKHAVQDWLVRTYSTDSRTEPSPLATDRQLLGFRRSLQQARKALRAGVGAVVFPLGFEDTSVKNYHVIKPSAFVFHTPGQRSAVLKQMQKFEDRTGCGL